MRSPVGSQPVRQGSRPRAAVGRAGAGWWAGWSGRLLLRWRRPGCRCGRRSGRETIQPLTAAARAAVRLRRRRGGRPCGSSVRTAGRCGRAGDRRPVLRDRHRPDRRTAGARRRGGRDRLAHAQHRVGRHHVEHGRPHLHPSPLSPGSTSTRNRGCTTTASGTTTRRPPATSPSTRWVLGRCRTRRRTSRTR